MTANLRRVFSRSRGGLTVALPSGFELRADPSALGDALLGMRALQALDVSPLTFPLHRSLRFAVHRPIEAVFDELAMLAAPRSQRMDVGSVLLELDGALVIARGRSRRDYVSGTASIWATDAARLAAAEAIIRGIAVEDRVTEEMFSIDWYFHSATAGLTHVTFEELADAAPLDAAYPSIEEGPRLLIEAFLDAPETILILQGPPGTGKTRLVRAALAAISRRKADSARVLFTSDKRALDDDELYLEFLTGEHDALVVEDADHLLGSRANGNVDLHRFLTVADGVVRAQGRKMIFTTNLPNVGDLDEALIRPGRCHGVVRTRLMTAKEAERLLDALHVEESLRGTVLRAAFADGARTASLAAVFKALPRSAAPRMRAGV